MKGDALAVHLRQETQYLARFDRIYRATDAAFDIRNNELHVLIAAALQNNGTISNNRRKRLSGVVPAAAIEFIEALAQAELRDSGAAE